MAKKRRGKSVKPMTAPARPPEDQEAGQAGTGRGKAAWAWLGGILGAVVVTAFGVVFTTWFNARGPEVLDELGSGPVIGIGHVAVDQTARDVALREPVTDPVERAVLVGTGTIEEKRNAVLDRHHGAPLDHTSIKVVLVGKRTGVRIIDIEPRVLDRQAVSDGALAFLSSAGEVETVELAADLDAPAPRFTAAKDPDESYFKKKQIDLKQGELVTLSLTVTGKKAYYEFDFLVTALAGDRVSKVEIKAPGNGPFRLTGFADAYRAYYAGSSSGSWQLISPAEACERRKLEGC